MPNMTFDKPTREREKTTTKNVNILRDEKLAFEWKRNCEIYFEQALVKHVLFYILQHFTFGIKLFVRIFFLFANFVPELSPPSPNDLYVFNCFVTSERLLTSFFLHLSFVCASLSVFNHTREYCLCLILWCFVDYLFLLRKLLN